MGHNSFIELQVGESTWLRLARYSLFVLALLSLLLASGSWGWKLAAAAGLLLILAYSGWQARCGAGIRVLRLYSNGAVTLLPENSEDIPAVIEGDAWISAWFCVLPVGRFDRWPKQRLLVCHSDNHPDDYRHLLSWLRLGNVSEASNGILGPR